MSRRALVLAVLVTVAACAPRRREPPPLPDADRLGPAFLARQRVIATIGDERRGFDAVLQYDGRELLLLGLTPMGTKAFAVRQRGRTATSETFVDRPLPAPPTAILLDVHWSYFLDGAAGPTARADGWHRRRVDGLRVRERWEGARIMQRTIVPPGGDPVHIRYDGGLPAGPVSEDFPDRVRLDHEGPAGLDLRLEITTVQHTPIAASR